jgi:DNA transposition AAA+ family ATPase
MSSTRYANTSEPSHAPERNLSAPERRPINISLAIAAQACRIYDPRTRAACLWLANLAANSQRIQLCWQERLLPDPLGTVGRISEVELAAKLGLEPFEIYSALSGHPDADLPKFRDAVEAFRRDFESQLPPLIHTSDSDTIVSAFGTAADEHKIVTVSGKWRHGKTDESQRLWLRNLHRCVWVHCPADATERSFLNAIAAALGISANGAKKPAVLREQIKRAFGIGLIDCMIVDEAHNLWPSDLTDTKPIRAEYLRELRDSLGLGVMLITTEQFALSLALAVQHNTRWAPGQFLGRRAQFKLSDIHTDAEILGIARLHGRALLPDAALPLFVEFAKAEEGYLGAMVTAIRQTLRVADAEGTKPTLEIVAAALKQQRTDERVSDLARMRPSRHGRRAPLALKGRRAA